MKKKLKILIANRGEIAVRIIRAAKILGMQTVAVYSEADKNSLHVAMADEAVEIGAASAGDSYLNIRAILAAAEISHADAIHPGYGFLSENAHFARLVEEVGLIFIGPTSQTIEEMGDKEQARQLMASAGVPIVPGSADFFESAEIGLREAERIGYPVMLKSVAGGGGKGMRLVSQAADFQQLFELAQSEIKNAVGDGRMYLEKLIIHPRHIEVQVLGDGQGKAIALGERDCTIQRHHQKVIEEAPSTKIDPETRQEMLTVAVHAAEQQQYRSAGTYEFLYQGPGQFYFMEMNTRIQVEHAISEEITGVDLVGAQLTQAAGGGLPEVARDNQGRVAIEARVVAQTAGKINFLHLPGGLGIRVETAIYPGYVVPPNYDAMILKIIATGPNRVTALQRLREAIGETVITGLKTNLDLLIQILNHPDFTTNENATDIDWLDSILDAEEEK